MSKVSNKTPFHRKILVVSADNIELINYYKSFSEIQEVSGQLPVSGQFPLRIIAPQLWLRVRLRLGLGLELGQFSLGAIVYKPIRAYFVFFKN